MLAGENVRVLFRNADNSFWTTLNGVPIPPAPVESAPIAPGAGEPVQVQPERRQHGQ